MNKKNTDILIWFEESDPPSFVGITFLWNIFSAELREDTISIPFTLEKNAKYFRSEYLNNINRMFTFDTRNKVNFESFFRIESGFSLWWMSSILEKNYGKSNDLSNAVKLLVFEDVRKNFNIDRLFCSASTPESILVYFRNLFNKNKVIHNFKIVGEGKTSIDLKLKNFMYRNLPSFWLGIITFVRFIIFCGGIHIRRLDLEVENKKLFFFDYFFHLKKTGNIFDSAYWGSLINYFRDKGKFVHFEHIFIPNRLHPKIKNAQSEVSSLNQSNDSSISHNVLEYVTPCLAFKVLVQFIKFNIMFLIYFSFRLKSDFKKNAFYTGLYLWNEVKSSLVGSIAIQNLFYFYFIKERLKKLPLKADLFFLMENQAWEKALVYLWKKEKDGAIFGVVHATVRFWDMRYACIPVKDGNSNFLFLPSSLIVNGNLAKNQLVEFGYSKNFLYSAEALRFLQLSKVKLFKKINKIKHLVVFTDYLESVSRFQMNLLSEIRIDKSYSIIIKPHPAFIIERKDYPNLDFTVIHDNIEKILEKADIVFCSNITSAALEAYYLGLPVVSARDPKELNFSPLFGLSDAMYVSNSIELLNAFNKIERGIYKVKRRQLLNLSLNLPRWKYLIENTSCVNRNLVN